MSWKRIALGLGAVVALVVLLRPSRVAASSLLVLGDSLTGSEGYCSTLKRLLAPRPVTCASYPNQGVKTIHKAGVELLAKGGDWDTVVVLAGVNDLASNRGADYTCAALDALYRGFAARGLKVVAVQLTPWASNAEGRLRQYETEQVNTFIKRHPIPVAVVDTSTVTGQGHDGLHLTERGGEQLALAVAEKVA